MIDSSTGISRPSLAQASSSIAPSEDRADAAAPVLGEAREVARLIALGDDQRDQALSQRPQLWTNRMSPPPDGLHSTIVARLVHTDDRVER